MVIVTALPQVINCLVDDLIDPVSFTIMKQILDLNQLLLQLMYASVANTRHLSHLQDLGYDEADSIHILFDLAYNVIPMLEAGVAGHTFGEISSKTTGALITVLACCPFFAITCPCDAVTLTCH